MNPSIGTVHRPVLRIKGLNVAPECIANFVRQSIRLDQKAQGRRGSNMNGSLNRLTINIPIGDHKLIIPTPDDLRDQKEKVYAGVGVGVKVASVDGQNIHDSSSRVPARTLDTSDAVDGTLEDAPADCLLSESVGAISSPIVDASYPQASPVGVSSSGRDGAHIVATRTTATADNPPGTSSMRDPNTRGRPSAS